MTDLREYFPPGGPRFTIHYLGRAVGSGAFGQFESGLVRLVGVLNLTDERFPYRGSFDTAIRLRTHEGIAVVAKLSHTTQQDHNGSLKIVGSQAVISVRLFDRPMVCTLGRTNTWSGVKIEFPGVTAEISLVPLTAKAEADLPADLTFDPATMPPDTDLVFAEEAAG